MSIAVASSPWSATSPAAAWSVREVSGGQGVEWVLRRNCSLSPRQVLGVYLSLCVVSAVIAAAFWWHGAPAVLWFAGLELSAVGVAWLVYACHATDRETITIERGVVRVEHRCGRRVEQVQLDPTWLRVEPAGGLVELSAPGGRVRVGRYLRTQCLPALVQELRRAVQWSSGRAPLTTGGREWVTETQSK
jgi:uncharacterized membrane protein